MSPATDHARVCPPLMETDLQVVVKYKGRLHTYTPVPPPHPDTALCIPPSTIPPLSPPLAGVVHHSQGSPPSSSPRGGSVELLQGPQGLSGA